MADFSKIQHHIDTENIMSTDYWWIICQPSDVEEQFLTPIFEESYLEFNSQKSIKSFLKEIKQKHEDFILNNTPVFYNKFINMFCLDIYQNLGSKILSESGLSGFKLNNQNCYTFTSINRCSPIAALYHSLGFYNFSLLPGICGNVFIPQSKILPTLNLVNEFINSETYTNQTNKANSILNKYSSGHNAEELITMLPNALNESLEKSCGFLSISMYSI